MNIQTILPKPHAVPPPGVVWSPSLLTETCSHTCLADSGDVTPKMLNFRVTHISVVLRGILEHLEQKGYRHGGAND